MYEILPAIHQQSLVAFLLPLPLPPLLLLLLLQVPDVAEAMELGLKAATLISQKFPPPVKLEFEKV
jgi:hypothetical protein